MWNSMRQGLPSTQMISFLFNSLHEQFNQTEIKDFDDFHAAILDILNVFNSALPGKHYDVPSRSDVEEYFEKWKIEQEPAKKEEVFIQFIKKIKLSKLDNNTIMAGILTPPAAMATKRAGELLPQLSFIKSIPDVVFIPSVTIAALVISKLSRRLYRRRVQVEPRPTEMTERITEIPEKTHFPPRSPSPPNL